MAMHKNACYCVVSSEFCKTILQNEPSRSTGASQNETLERTRIEIQRIKGSCRGGGRKRKKPQSRGLLADVIELTKLSRLWSQFHEKVWASFQDDYAQIFEEPIDAKTLRKQLNHAVTEIKALCQAAGKTKKSLKELLAKFPTASSP